MAKRGKFTLYVVDTTERVWITQKGYMALKAARLQDGRRAKAKRGK